VNASTWQTIGVIFAILTGTVSVYLMSRSSARESARQVADAKDRAVEDAVRPLNDTITQLRTDIRGYLTRINELEDELRRGRGYGGDDRAGR
jgi:CHASE3 domain sensor protein